MEACKGYEVKPCLLPRKDGSEFCCACSVKEQRGHVLKFIKDIEYNNISNDQILAFFETQAFTSCLSRNLRWEDTMDNLLSAVYTRDPTLLHSLVTLIQTNNRMHTNFILRIREHAKTSLCRVYVYLLKNKLYDADADAEMFPSQSCIHCLTKKIANCKNFNDFSILNNCKQLLNSESDTEKFFTRAYEVVQSLAESPHYPITREEIENFLYELLVIAKRKEHPQECIEAFQKKVYEHPLLLPQKIQTIRAFMKERTAPWKIGWLAKALHPSRVQGWCCDKEALEEFKNFGMPMEYIPIQKGKKAEWNIDFD